MNRESARERFLAGCGWSGAAIVPLAADASFRRYFRLTAPEGDSVLLMDAPPEHEETAPFVAVARHLADLGLSAPQILARDAAAGFLLLEDFGDATFTRLLAGGHDEAALYRGAIDVLVALHRHPATIRIDLPPYDLDALLGEAALFVDWYLPAMTGRAATPATREAYLQAWREGHAALPDTPDTLVLRDYHVDNVMQLNGRSGVAGCGLLDFQDALRGPRAYDVVSLLEDARRDLAPTLAGALRQHYIDGMGGSMEPLPAFDAWYAFLGAQRHAKVAGIFVRLQARDGKGVYLNHIPRVVRLLRGQLGRTEALAPLAAWLAEHLPDFDRPLPPAAAWPAIHPE